MHIGTSQITSNPFKAPQLPAQPAARITDLLGYAATTRAWGYLPSVVQDFLRPNIQLRAPILGCRVYRTYVAGENVDFEPGEWFMVMDFRSDNLTSGGQLMLTRPVQTHRYLGASLHSFVKIDPSYLTSRHFVLE